MPGLRHTSPATDTRPDPLPETSMMGVWPWRAPVRALGGRRFCPAPSLKQVQAPKVPRHALPDWVVRVGALVIAEMRQMRPNLGRRSNLSAAYAEKVLGWRTRPAADSIADAGRG